MRQEDLQAPGGGRVDTPTGWELLRRLDKLEERVTSNHRDVLTAIQSAYSKEYIDGAHSEFRRRLDVLEVHNLTQAHSSSTARTQLVVVGLASVLTFAGNLALFVFR